LAEGIKKRGRGERGEKEKKASRAVGEGEGPRQLRKKTQIA